MRAVQHGSGCACDLVGGCPPRWSGEWPEMQLTIRHLRRAEDRIVARRHTARVARRGRRQDDGWRQLDGRERASWHWCAESKPAQRLYAAQVAILREYTQRRRRGIGADGVQPATLYPDARAECARPVTECLKRYARSREQPYGDGCVLRALPDAREHRRDGGPLRRESGGQEREPEQPPHGKGNER